QGDRGLAISIEGLPTLWPEVSAEQLTINNEQPPTLQPSHPPVNQAGKQGATMPRSIKLFFSYAHEDEELRDELAKHLRILERQGIISAWYDRDITAGMEWANAIDDNLNTADIILLLVSPDFIASDYCYDQEMKRAMERHEAGEAIVIPVILRKTNWTSAPFSKLQALPKNAKPVKSWTDQDEAFTFISEQIQKVAQMLANRPAPSPAPAVPPVSAGSTVVSAVSGPAAPAATASYNTGAIRRLLTAAYDDFGFDILCTDNFPEVSAQFSRGMSLAEKIQRLIVYCQQHLAFPRLLDLVKQERPAMYEQFRDQLFHSI
ncbi:MAG TPA: TIR domain-containing protein, partial [Anaerolineae bacterium]|nr:TIR domain-containing protein [Anaerolineae bacterium]